MNLKRFLRPSKSTGSLVAQRAAIRRGLRPVALRPELGSLLLEDRTLPVVSAFAAPAALYSVTNDVAPAGLSVGDTVTWNGSPSTPGLTFGTSAFTTIQQAINSVDPGGTVKVGPGQYDELLTVNKRFTLEGAGSGSNTATNTVIRGAIMNRDVITVQFDQAQNAATQSVFRAFRVSTFPGSFTTTADWDGIQVANGLISNGVSASDDQGNILFDNIAAVNNAGSGIHMSLNSSGVANNLTYLNCDLSSNGIAGLRLNSQAAAFNATIQGGQMNSNNQNGLIVLGRPGLTRNVAINGTSFNGNANGAPLNRGFGGITFYGIDGNLSVISLANVNVNAVNSDFGIYFDGARLGNVGTNPPVSAGNNINFNNVSVTGSPINQDILFSGFIQANGNGLFNNTILNSTAGIALELRDIEGPVNVNNVVFDGPASRIALANRSRATVDATHATFRLAGGLVNATAATLSELFAIENKIIHGVDASPYGLARVRPNDLFVTPSSFDAPLTNAANIQRAVIKAMATDRINVSPGTYYNTLVIPTSIAIQGDAASASNVAIQPVALVRVTVGSGAIIPDGLTLPITVNTMGGPETKNFEFDLNGAGLLNPTNVPIPYLATDTAEQVAAKVAIAINSTSFGAGTGLVSADPFGAVVQVSNQVPPNTVSTFTLSSPALTTLNVPVSDAVTISGAGNTTRLSHLWIRNAVRGVLATGVDTLTLSDLRLTGNTTSGGQVNGVPNLFVDGSLNNDTINVSATQIQQNGENVINYVGTANLALNASLGVDIVNASPSTTTHYVLNGGGPSGDTLNVDAQGQLATLTSDQVLVDTFLPIDYLQFDFVNVLNQANRVPVANPDSASTPNNSVVAIPVLNNDTDPDVGQTISVVGVGSPVIVAGSPSMGAGSTSFTPNSVIYSPPAGFEGVVQFNYTIADNGSPSLQSSATVTVSVTPTGVPTATTATFIPSSGTLVITDNSAVGRVMTVFTSTQPATLGRIQVQTQAGLIAISGGIATSSNTTTVIINTANGHDRITLTNLTGLTNPTIVVNTNGGNDTVTGSQYGDQISTGAGNDSVDGAGGNDTITGGIDDDILSGGDNDDQIFGDIGTDTINGDGGNDYLSGGSENDLIEGGSGDDTLDGGEGNDNLSGGTSNDHLLGGVGNDTLLGGAGHDTGFGGDGDDIMLGEDGNDYFSGEDGNDGVYGGNNDDTLVGGTGNDLIEGEEGNDVLFGSQGTDTLRGGNGTDQLDGGSQTDLLEGGSGNDTVFGGLLESDLDSLFGNAGADLFLLLFGDAFPPGPPLGKIKDFNGGEGDTFQFLV